MKNFYITIFLIIIYFPNIGFSQDSLNNELELNTELKYEVIKVFPYISITEEELNEANSLSDLNSRYKSSWIKEYISVEILTSQNGGIIKSIGKNNKLNQEQKDMMNSSDIDSCISIRVNYIPENSLSNNEPKELSFNLTIEPEIEAKYPGGQKELNKYLKEKAIDKIPINTFKNYDLAIVKFTINQKGEIVNAHIIYSTYHTSSNEKIDTLLLETIRNMPCWRPAEYSDGTKTKQEYALAVGNMGNCMIHLLNIHKNGL